jgi:hypothetical protein
MLNAPTPFDVEAPPAPDYAEPDYAEQDYAEPNYSEPGYPEPDGTMPSPDATQPTPHVTQPFHEAWRLETPHLDAGPAETRAFETPASFGEVPAGGGRAPLPRRVRGGNLAPQLRDDPRATPRTAPAHPDDALVAWEERSAEASRDLFAALQAGWLRGRDEDEAPDGREWA